MVFDDVCLFQLSKLHKSPAFTISIVGTHRDRHTKPAAGRRWFGTGPASAHDWGAAYPHAVG